MERWVYADDAGNVARWTRTYDGKASRQKTSATRTRTACSSRPSGSVTRAADPGADAPTTAVRYLPDAEGRPLEVTDELGNTTKYTYTERGQIASEQPPGQPTRYHYDEQGNLLRKLAPRENSIERYMFSTSYAYDDAGRVTKVIDPYGSVTKMEYDEAGNLKRTEDAEGREWSHDYNGFGELVETRGPVDTSRRSSTAIGAAWSRHGS